MQCDVRHGRCLRNPPTDIFGLFNSWFNDKTVEVKEIEVSAKIECCCDFCLICISVLFIQSMVSKKIPIFVLTLKTNVSKDKPVAKSQTMTMGVVHSKTLFVAKIDFIVVLIKLCVIWKKICVIPINILISMNL